MGYDAPDRRTFNERVAADHQASLDRQAACDNWLSTVLVEVEQEEENSAERRASIAFHKRATRRYAAFVTKANSATEFESRVAVIEDGLRETATEVAREYGSTNGEDMYTAARTAAGDFFYPETSPWAPGGAVADAASQNQMEVCPHCKMSKPVGAACPNCGFNAPATAGTGAELGGLQQRMNSVKESHPNCTGEGCKFCENKGKFKKDKGGESSEGDSFDGDEDDGGAESAVESKVAGEHDFGFDADEGDDSAEGKDYRKNMKGREEGKKKKDDDGDEDDEKESSYHEKLAMAVSKKDFVAIAEILKRNGADPNITNEIATYFQSQNQNFDNRRFQDAAGAGGQQPQQFGDVRDDLGAGGPGSAIMGHRTAGIHSSAEDMWHHVGAGAELRGDKYEYERVSPDAEIGDGSVATGPSYKTDTVEDVLKGSKDHPSERREVLDFDAAENTDPKVERKVDTQDLGGDDPYSEQTGKGQGGTFGDSHGTSDPVTDTSDAKLGSALNWHVL